MDIYFPALQDWKSIILSFNYNALYVLWRIPLEQFSVDTRPCDKIAITHTNDRQMLNIFPSLSLSPHFRTNYSWYTFFLLPWDFISQENVILWWNFLQTYKLDVHFFYIAAHLLLNVAFVYIYNTIFPNISNYRTINVYITAF